ncbi:MAG TPA: hypothetical protein VGM07_22405 [Stellaceae bacterium]
MAVALSALLLLAACAMFAPTRGWTKTGVDADATARQARDCRAQATAGLANEREINQDISATLGGNWQRARTASVVDQSLRHQASSYADEVFDSCMRAKGFKKAG